MTRPTPDAILAALQAGDAAQAARLARQGLEQEPDSADLLVLFALSQWRLGDRATALETYARLTRLYPDEVVHWRNHATALFQAGDLPGAEAAYEQAVKLAPDDAEGLQLLGLVQMDLGKRVEARDTLLRAFGKAPDSPAIRIDAALACVACRDARAENLLRPWRQWMPLDDELESKLAEALAQQGDVTAAVELLEDLTRRLPGLWRLRVRLAGLYERMNRLEEAEALLDQVERERADSGLDERSRREITHQRARLAARHREHSAALSILDAPEAGGEYNCAHWFLVAQAHDKLGETTAAMAALKRAHALQIEEIKQTRPHWFEPDAAPSLVIRTRVTADDYAKWPVLKAPDAMHSPVFVVGFPRSGTTLLEQMLDAHPLLQSMDERPFFSALAKQLASVDVRVPEDLGKLDQRDCDELRKGYVTLACEKVPRRWDARLVDKNPLNLQWLPMIHRMFPEAKFILALRHPCDVLLSNYMQNFMASSLSAVCADLETLARAYVEVMENWIHHVEVFNPSVFVSRYEDLVADPAQQTRRIAGHLDLEDAAPMLNYDQRAREKEFIATPSYTQVIEPINRKGVGRWQRYREYFEPVLPILQPMLERWGYRADETIAADS
ncbi:MAG TPA: sulfotransferase [Rhodanobacteraceae bacterium]|nr:sulfotransferase [Rhodanobacteraceae bacterium]